MTDEVNTSAVIVAVPADSDPIHAASSEDVAHMTLVWMGDAASLSPDQLANIDAYLKDFVQDLSGEITEQVSGHATLGADGAQVLLMDAAAFGHIRNGLLEMSEPDVGNTGPIRQAYEAVEQFPNWLPHVTLGYPEAPPAGEFTGDSITFDRLELWTGDDHVAYPFGGDPDGEDGSTPADENPAGGPAGDPLDETELGDEYLGAKKAFAAVVDEAIERPLDTEALTGEYEDDEPDDVDEDEDGDLEDFVEIPFHGVAAPIGVPSGDKRMFAADGTVRFRDFPFPLRYQRADTGPHTGAVVVGRIDRMWVEDQLIKYTGFFNSMPEVDEVITGIVDGSIRGVSVDVDESSMQAPELPDAANIDDVVAAIMDRPMSIFTDVRVAALTTVAIPAFGETYIALGECDCEDMEDEDELDEAPLLAAGGVIKGGTTAMIGENGSPDYVIPLSTLNAPSALEKFAPGTKDGPGWITDPVPTARLRRYWTKGKGAAKIKWGVPGDFNRCRRQLAKYITNPDWLAGACANMHKEAIGVWPGQEGVGRGKHSVVASGAEMSPSVVLVASVNSTVPAERFENPRLTGPTPFTIDDDGRVYGHLATWGTCHIGFPGVCTTPPMSKTNYAYFTTGVVDTDRGPVPVGQITMDTGHAGPRGTLRKSLAHYDHTGTAVADVAAGEDSYGIWVAGMLRSNVTDAQIASLKAAALSGDWRSANGNLEMIAALAVNVPGFPIPRRASFASNGSEQLSLVASGIVPSVSTSTGTPFSMDDMVGMVAAVADELEYRNERKAKIAKAQPQKLALRAARIARAREIAPAIEKDQS